MATTTTLRKILDRKQWEILNAGPTGMAAAYVAQSSLFDQYQLWMVSTSVAFLYDPREDAWARTPTSGLTTFTTSAGSVCYHPAGPTGTASAGGASTITTVTSLPGSIAGYTIRITAGTGAGQERIVASNTYGANAVITTTATWGTNPDNTSVYLLLTGRFYVFNGSTTQGIRYYDIATNTWSASLSVTNVPPAVGASWRLVATPAFGNTTASGTATAGAASTLTNSGKAWATNMWANYQVRITSGTGAGQVRTIASNTGTVLTVSANWATNPDATSVYAIEPNDDYLYLLGGNVVTLTRYSISGNSWTTLSPGVARTALAGSGCTANWIGVASDASWADETSIKNGRYVYSFQGGGSGNLSYYDIAANTWINETTTYQRGGASDFVPNTSWSYCTDREFVYIGTLSASIPQQWWRYNCVTRSLDPWSMWSYPFSSLTPGEIYSSVVSYTDGGTTIRWVYLLPNAVSPFALFRMMII